MSDILNRIRKQFFLQGFTFPYNFKMPFDIEKMYSDGIYFSNEDFNEEIHKKDLHNNKVLMDYKHNLLKDILDSRLFLDIRSFEVGLILSVAIVLFGMIFTTFFGVNIISTFFLFFIFLYSLFDLIFIKNYKKDFTQEIITVIDDKKKELFGDNYITIHKDEILENYNGNRT
jgi:hypothetical protein